MEHINDILSQTISRILGEAAFIFTDTLPAANRPQIDNWDSDGLSLRFTGNPDGTIHMWVGHAFASLVAANMLGVDSDTDDARKKGIDALMEILNIITGNFLTAAFGEKTVFSLSLPEKLPPDSIADDSNDENAIWLSADEYPVLFLIRDVKTI